ncbi:putative nucleolar complex-associated protein [Septoria linicola]|nr:putative nucleolar complex-associated protein [Septoria linicola]
MAEPATKRRRLSPPGDRTPGFANYDLEQDYAERLAKRKQKDKKQDKLLVKTQDGRIVENPRVDAPQADEEDADSFMASNDEDSGVVADVQPKQRKPAKSTLPVKDQVRLAKEELAKTAQTISEDPEEHINQLGTLAELARSDIVTIKKLALATQLAVFKDIIPGYRIRPMSDKDMTGKISKDVKRLRSFEQGLLSGYKDYISNLQHLATGKTSKTVSQQEAQGLATVAISCACALLVNVPHFNNRGDLIGILVKKLAGRNVNADFAKCRETLEQLFRDDEEGHASLDVVAQLTTMMKKRDYAIHESVLNTFLHLRLLNEFSQKGAPNRIDKREGDDAPKPKFKKEFRTKRERKIMKERKQVEKELKEADATVSYEEKDKNQAETLKLVFIAYFRILKERIQHLMGAVLEGLAKYAHLINQDFFGDVLEALKDLINDAEAALQATHDEDADGEDEPDDAERRNATRESLLCIITAFALLQGQIDVVKSASSLSLDLSFFIRQLYRTLVPLAMDLDIELSAKKAHLSDPNGLHVPSTSSKDNKINVSTTAVLLLRSLQSVLMPPINTKNVPPVRVAAFVKQLEMLSLHLPQKSAIAVQELLKSVTKTHGKKIAALWYTEERRGNGVFDPLGQEVESSNPFASTVWEGEILRHHFDPKVREAVKVVETNVKDARA